MKNDIETPSEGVNTEVVETQTVVDDGVLQTYPSFSEIVSNPKYNFHLLISQQEKFFMSVIPSKWEFVVRGVHRMCEEMYGLGFYESYCFQPTSDPYDYDSSVNIEGVGYVYDSRGNTHKVDYNTFLKLTLVMYLSFMGIPLTDEQYESYLKFRNSSDTVYRILD